MAFSQPSTKDIVTPRALAVESDTPTNLQTAVDAVTNELNKTLRSPAIGQTTGPVVNGSITLSLVAVWVANGTGSYIQTVFWQEWVIPT